VKRLGDRILGAQPGSLKARTDQRLAAMQSTKNLQMTERDRLRAYQLAKSGPARLHAFDRNTQDLVNIPGTDQNAIVPNPQESARLYEQAVLSDSLTGGTSAQNFRIPITGNFTSEDQDIEQFRDHLSGEAQTAFKAKTREFDGNLARALTRRRGRFESLDEYEQFINRVPGASGLIGSHVRQRGRDALKKTDPHLFKRLEATDHADAANEESFERWVSDNYGTYAKEILASPDRGPDSQYEISKRFFNADRDAVKYEVDPVSNRLAIKQPKEMTQVELLRESKVAADDQLRELGPGYTKELSGGLWAVVEDPDVALQKRNERATARIEEQNVQRATHGLPPVVPLTDPQTGELRASELTHPKEEKEHFDDFGQGRVWESLETDDQRELLFEMMDLQSGFVTNPEGGTAIQLHPDDEEGKEEAIRRMRQINQRYGLPIDPQNVLTGTPREESAFNKAGKSDAELRKLARDFIDALNEEDAGSYTDSDIQNLQEARKILSAPKPQPKKQGKKGRRGRKIRRGWGPGTDFNTREEFLDFQNREPEPSETPIIPGQIRHMRDGSTRIQHESGVWINPAHRR
jgi:hypothetical protein